VTVSEVEVKAAAAVVVITIVEGSTKITHLLHHVTAMLTVLLTALNTMITMMMMMMMMMMKHQVKVSRGRTLSHREKSREWPIASTIDIDISISISIRSTKNLRSCAMLHLLLVLWCGPQIIFRTNEIFCIGAAAADRQMVLVLRQVSLTVAGGQCGFQRKAKAEVVGAVGLNTILVGTERKRRDSFSCPFQLKAIFLSFLGALQV
jgi:hypothetical protein